MVRAGCCHHAQPGGDGSGGDGSDAVDSGEHPVTVFGNCDDVDGQLGVTREGAEEPRADEQAQYPTTSVLCPEGESLQEHSEQERPEEVDDDGSQRERLPTRHGFSECEAGDSSECAADRGEAEITGT